MSDPVSSAEEIPPESADAFVSPGALIRAAREAAGVHVDVLAAALKITVDRLEALEADRYAALPDMVFARALASSACRILKMDPAPVLALMPKVQGQPLPVDRVRINTSIHEEKHGQSLFRRQLTRPIGVAVVVLLLGAAALFFLPERGGGVPEIANNAPAPALTSVEMAANQSVPSAPAQESSNSFSPAPASVAAAASEGAGVKEPVLPNEVPASVAEPKVPAHGVLEFRAREATWVQVRDATKAVVFERILAKGASATATGTLPLSVVIGKADSMDVFVRGEPFALAGMAKDNVARFEVK